MARVRRIAAIAALIAAALVVAGCAAAPPADADTANQIATLEAQLAEAQAAGGDEAAVEELQAQLEEAQAAAEAAEAEAAEAVSQACSYNAYRLGWVMDYADANNIVNEVFGPTSDFQYTFWGSTYPDEAAAFEEIVAQALTETDGAARAELWQQAEDIQMDDLAIGVPMWHYDRFGLVKDYVDYFYPPFGAPKIALWSMTNGSTTIRYALGATIPSLDIQDSTDTTSSAVLYQMIDAPYRFNEEGGIEPLAAESYEVSEDGSVYTIKLREDAVWSDGEPVIAQHFVDGITRLLSPDMANDYAYVMFPIAGAAEFNAGEAETLDSVRAVDDYTLEITLTGALSYFDSILAFSTMHPVRLDVVEANPDNWTDAGVFVSNGAYVLTENRPGEIAVLQKNENYWNADNITIETIEFPIILEPATALAAFENGEIDVNIEPDLPPDDIPRLFETPEFARLPQPGTWYLGLNTSAEHTSDLNFRRALNLAVDKRTILDNVLQVPWRTEAYGFIPPEIQGYQGDGVGYTYDPEAAVEALNAYMESAGIDDPSTIVIELWFNSEGNNPEALEAVASMWEETLGIDVRTVGVEFGTYLDTLEECNVIGGGGF